MPGRLERVVPASLAVVVAAALLAAGCHYGPNRLHATRLPYNEAVKVTSEEQLLLNIVRLRYSDTPSSLSVTTIAAQFELAKQLQFVPFFAPGGDANPRAFGAVLPGAQVNTADRPTLSLTPQDEGEFTRRLFTPLSLDGIIYLAKTTWPISTVFRLYLENLNWVSNAQTASGPTPTQPPEFERFLRGIEALQRLQDRNEIAILLDEAEEKVGGPLPASRVTARAIVEAAKASLEFKPADEAGGQKGEGGKQAGERWSLVRKKEVPYLHVHPAARTGADWAEVARMFRLKPGLSKYEIEVTKLTPFPEEYPAEGVAVFDLETRSLLQVLYFVAHGVEVPPHHVAGGLARVTVAPDGMVFDYQRVLGGLFHVRWCPGKKRPADAAVAVCYRDGWFYIPATDHDTRATFALLLFLSRLELGTRSGTGPMLTLPLAAGR